MIAPTKKIWGTVNHFFLCNSGLMLSHLTVRRGFRCSRHKHEERYNGFLVISGTLCIEIWSDPEGAGEPERSVLEEGDFLTVPPGVFHRFRVMESGTVIETYWVDEGGTVRIDDIVRLDEGGPDFS